MRCAWNGHDDPPATSKIWRCYSPRPRAWILNKRSDSDNCGALHDPNVVRYATWRGQVAAGGTVHAEACTVPAEISCYGCDTARTLFTLMLSIEAPHTGPPPTSRHVPRLSWVYSKRSCMTVPAIPGSFMRTRC